ncbi:MAG: ECF transporter S component [Chloroflexaceae bacterium]|jgi:energy-coupling factor transport system substrate-specific component|nr:ECF transporter S component [Chloroflexaceae bacterium]
MGAPKPVVQSRSTWSTRDILVTAMIALTLGLVLAGVSYVYTVARSALGPAIGGAIFGAWFCLPGLLTMYMLRRPGAAFLAQVLVAFVQMPFDPSGWVGAAPYLVNGVLCELPFLVTRYRRYGMGVFVCAGLLVNMLFLALGTLVFGAANLNWAVTAVAAGLALMTGVFIPWLARRLGDALIQRGVLDHVSAAPAPPEAGDNPRAAQPHGKPD